MAKKRITAIYPRDKHALSALARCGYVSREQLGEFLREKRVQAYCKDGLVEKSIYSRSGARAQDVEVYRLTKAGRELCRRELSLSTYCARNPAHDLVLADKGVALVSDKENIDTGTATGKLIITVIAAINEFERANLLERQREGIAIAKRQGKYKGRPSLTVPDLPRHYDCYQRREISKAALARELGISRPTLDRLFARYERQHKGAQDQLSSR